MQLHQLPQLHHTTNYIKRHRIFSQSNSESEFPPSEAEANYAVLESAVDDCDIARDWW